MDEFTISIPRERPFATVAGLVIGGIVARHDVTLDVLNDLQLALDGVLERSDEDEGQVTIEIRVDNGTIATFIGPVTESTAAELEQEAGDSLGLRRLLETVVDSVTLSERDEWLVDRAAQGLRAGGRQVDMTRASDKALLRRYHEEGDLAAREQLIEQYLSLVRSLARRYAYRGEQLDDLVQIGCIGLIKAIDRFDLDRGVELTTYATPNIIGEIKRHFRDKGWAVRVPRGLQELNVQLSKIVEEQTIQLGRSPTIPELAKAAGVEEELVLEALESGRAYTSLSLSVGGSDEDGELDPLESLGTEEHQYSVSEDRAVLAPGFPRARRTRAAHPPPALLRRVDAEPDRAAGRDLADARLPPDPAGAREDPRRDRVRRGARDTRRQARGLRRPTLQSRGAYDGRAARGLPLLLRGEGP